MPRKAKHSKVALGRTNPGEPTSSSRPIKGVFEPQVESEFLPDSYGYRAGKWALDAIGVTRERWLGAPSFGVDLLATAGATIGD